MKTYEFDFGIGESPASPFIQILPESVYSQETGYGFLPGGCIGSRIRSGGDRLRSAFCIPMEAAFRVDLPNGCYTLTAIIGDELAPTVTTIQFGKRSTVLSRASTIAGQYSTYSFTVKVKEEHLKLAFSGITPRINYLRIQPAPSAMTVFLAGDSTVTDQETFPYAGWGQMLPLYFKAEVAVDNRAVSGRSSRSFIDEGRLEAIMEEIRPGDHLWIQFGHNDQKSDSARHTEPFGSYKDMLLKYIQGARSKGAQPVLVTSMHRRRFDDNGELVDTHGDYLAAMRELAKESDTQIIDLAVKSEELFTLLGAERCKELFMWGLPGEFIAFSEGVKDDTHFQEAGAMKLAELVVEGVRELNLTPVALYLRA
ncbi:rhamnogalacturonan acetylesterase [Paenibacillus sp. CAU 1782]